MPTTLPLFHVRDTRGEEMTSVLGSVTRTTHGQENWVGDGWVGFLKAGDTLIAGRWCRREDLWAFAPENVGNLEVIRALAEWEVLGGYWGERAEIVLDQTRRWRKALFLPTDAVQFQGPAGVWLTQATASDAGGSEVIKDGWDHEHCAICWKTLGPGGQPEGYVSTQRNWVCERCYIDFVDRRSLHFIPSV